MWLLGLSTSVTTGTSKFSYPRYRIINLEFFADTGTLSVKYPSWLVTLDIFRLPTVTLALESGSRVSLANTLPRSIYDCACNTSSPKS